MPDKEIAGLTAGATPDGTEIFHGVQGGSSRRFTGAQLATLGADPVSDGGDGLGTASKRWSDLFLTSGGIINWANGDATLTHSANALSFAGASSGYSFDVAPNVAGNVVKTAGRETHPIPASEWCPTITNGCGRSYTELATNDLISDTLDFSTTTQEFATAIWCPPKKYDGGTITFRVKHRLPNSDTGETVDYALSGAFIRDDDAADATLGTAVVVTDTWIADADQLVSPESSAVTLAGTYAEGCKVALKLQRNVAGDNAAGDALVEAVEIFWTSNAGTDT